MIKILITGTNFCFALTKYKNEEEEELE